MFALFVENIFEKMLLPMQKIHLYTQTEKFKPGTHSYKTSGKNIRRYNCLPVQSSYKLVINKIPKPNNSFVFYSPDAEVMSNQQQNSEATEKWMKSVFIELKTPRNNIRDLKKIKVN